jgi:hypothetical protein
LDEKLAWRKGFLDKVWQEQEAHLHHNSAEGGKSKQFRVAQGLGVSTGAFLACLVNEARDQSLSLKTAWSFDNLHAICLPTTKEKNFRCTRRAASSDA